MKGFFLFVAACTASLLLNAALFSFLPILGYLQQHLGLDSKGNAKETFLVALPVMPKKKEKSRSHESLKPVEKKTAEPGKNLARQRFVMDLGSGGGTGAAGGAAVSKGDLKQVSYEEGETDVDAKPLSQPSPQRPKKAVAAGMGGLVRCLLTVGENGKVVDVQFLEVPPNYGFEEAVREAVSHWRYQAAMVGGVAVRQKIEQPFKF